MARGELDGKRSRAGEVCFTGGESFFALGLDHSAGTGGGWSLHGVERSGGTIPAATQPGRIYWRKSYDDALIQRHTLEGMVERAEFRGVFLSSGRVDAADGGAAALLEARSDGGHGAGGTSDDARQCAAASAGG